MSVSPPPGGGSGLASIGEQMWKESPRCVERWTKLFDVDVPHGPDSHRLPSLSTWIIGSPSVRRGPATLLGPIAMPPVARYGFDVARPAVNVKFADPESPPPVPRLAYPRGHGATGVPVTCVAS